MLRRLPPQSIGLLLAAGAALLIPQLVLRFLVSLGDEWSDARLAPTFGLLHGVPLWFPYGEGPVLDAIYGPVGPLTWLPATLAATPTGAIAIALAMSVALLLAPALWIVRIESRGDRTLVAATLLLGVALLLSSPALPVIGVHADVPALSFASLAIASVWTGPQRRSAGWVWAGAAFVVASAGSKQVMAPLLVAWPAWIALTSGRLAARRALAALLGVGSAALVAVVLAFDQRSMIDAAVLGPLRHPWIDETWPALRIVAIELLQRALPIVTLLAAAVWFLRRRYRTWARAAEGERWMFPLAVGIACIPTSLVGGAKVGGAANSLAFTIWFVWLALLAAIALAGRRGGSRRVQFTGAAALIGCALALRLAPDLADLPGVARRSPATSVAFAAARTQPESIYFPYRPVVGMMADGRAYHLDPGLYFRELEGRILDERFVRAHLPRHLQRVAADRPLMPHSLNYLPRYRRQILDPSLPGWIVMTESDLLKAGEMPAATTSAGAVPADLPVIAPRTLDGPVVFAQPTLTVPDRSRRPTLRFEAGVESTTPLQSIDVEVLLRDSMKRQVMSLAARVAVGPEGRVSAEWPVYSDLLRSAAGAVALVRSAHGSGGEQWEAAADEIRRVLADDGESRSR